MSHYQVVRGHPGLSKYAFIAVNLFLLLFFLLITEAFGQQSGTQGSLPSNPIEGRLVFEEKGCISCHSINGYGGEVGPDLGENRFYGNFYDLASRLWNHAPDMMIQSDYQRKDWPSLTTRDVDRLIAYLFYLRYLGEPGSVLIGRQLINDRGCLQCHKISDQGAANGIPLDQLESYASPLYIAQVIWNHGPEMLKQMETKGLKRPEFADEDITHISAYLREFSGGVSGRRRYMPPGNPKAGAIVFKLKGCSVCHLSEGGSRAEVPLDEMDLHRSVTAIAGTMWNHGQLMLETMQEQGVAWPLFEGSEMADLIAYMYFHDYTSLAGKPEAGKVLFESKGCANCHGSGKEIRQSAEYPLQTPADLIRTMWNHVPHMRELVLTKNIPWPELSADQLQDLFAYISANH